MINVNNVTKTYGKGESAFKALGGVSFQVETGESIAIIGKSGSGKSTLMHVMSSLDRPSSGDITIDDHNISKMKSKKINKFRNNEIGFVFQTFYLQPKENCLENIIIPLEIAGLSPSKRKKIAFEALKSVGLEDKAKNKAMDLSGGQKQRLCIARAIVNNPSIIFADEPTGNLDSESGDHIIKLLFDLNKNKGNTLVIVTHDPDIAKLCNRRIHITDGLISTID